MSVQVTGLTKIYGTQRAVDAIDFSAKAGEVLGFLGPNGAGKTTTMKMITGYIPVTQGTAVVCGHDVTEDPLGAQRNIGYLPEHNPLYHNMYVREYLTFMAGLHKIRRPGYRISELIDMTGLGQEQHKQIGALSKGYRQRVGLAQAMLHDPQVLILDEPTSGLDPNQLAEIRALIKMLGEEKTVIFSTHIMQEVQALCDRVLIINQGRIVADDPIAHLQSHIRGEVAITIGLQNKVDHKILQNIKGVLRVEPLEAGRYRLHAHTENDIRPAIFHTCVKHQWVLLEMQQESLSVEDVFRHLTLDPTNV